MKQGRQIRLGIKEEKRSNPGREEQLTDLDREVKKGDRRFEQLKGGGRSKSREGKRNSYIESGMEK